ncbi:MAG: uracil-DNA glycosylase [Planctomycetia bacterium]|nr:uracil-DNA glycosylase [Planctomycetia bacterium]
MAISRRVLIQRLRALQLSGVLEISNALRPQLCALLAAADSSVETNVSHVAPPAPSAPSYSTPDSRPGSWEASRTESAKLAVEERRAEERHPVEHNQTSTTPYPEDIPYPWEVKRTRKPGITSMNAPKKTPPPLEVLVPHEDLSYLAEMSDRHEALRLLHEKVARCTRCLELVANRSQTVLGVGNPYAELMFLGEAPGRDEDKQGVPFVGRAGKLLSDMIEKGMRISRAEESYICNILRCRPPGNRNPLPIEALNCRYFLDTQISIIRPKFICCLGACASQFLLNETTTISRMRLREYEYRGAKVVCTYHPAYLLRNPSQKKAAWEDLQFLMKLMGIEPRASS